MSVEQRITRRREIAIGLVLIIVMTAGLMWWLAGAVRSRGPADSSSPEFADVDDRVSWMNGRIRGRVPSKIVDAQFRQIHNDIPAGHMGPGYTMRFLRARITISPADAPAWVARTKPMPAPPFSAPETPRDQMTAAERPGAMYYDPEPLLCAVDGGHMAITADNTTVFVSIRY
jgi:hypothetical protein